MCHFLSFRSAKIWKSVALLTPLYFISVRWKRRSGFSYPSLRQREPHQFPSQCSQPETTEAGHSPSQKQATPPLNSAFCRLGTQAGHSPSQLCRLSTGDSSMPLPLSTPPSVDSGLKQATPPLNSAVWTGDSCRPLPRSTLIWSNIFAYIVISAAPSRWQSQSSIHIFFWEHRICHGIQCLVHSFYILGNEIMTSGIQRLLKGWSVIRMWMD